MTEFWIAAILLLVLAVGFALWPLWRSSADEVAESVDSDSITAYAERKRQNILIYKDRIAELEHERDLALIDAAQFNALKAELEHGLLADLDLGLDVDNQASDVRAGVNQGAQGRPVLLSAVVILVLGGLAGLGYAEWGAYDKQQQYLAARFAPHELQQAKQAAQSGDIGSLISQLYSKLQAAPDNIEGWTLLARTAMNVQKYDLALESYQNVVASLERGGQNSAPVYGLMAQAEYLKAGGRLSARAQAALDLALSKNPIESNALGLKAVHAFETGDYQQAALHWQVLLDNYPEHPARAQIQSGIARAQSFLAERSPGQLDQAPNDESAQDQPKMRATIKLQVSLSSELIGRAAKTDTVFIFARAANGPPMPLAASRHTVADLPISIVLSDAMAMTPSARLSNVDRVDVVARISKSGQPLAQPGDLFAKRSDVSVGSDKQVDLVIDQVQP